MCIASRSVTAPLRRGILILAVTSTTACAPAIGGFGTDGRAPERAADFFGALSVRFGVAHRDARFEAIRPRLVRHALAPSRLYPDTTVWTSAADDVRTVSVAGSMTGNRYVLAARAAVPTPRRTGDSRHIMNLRRVSPDIHRWDSTDELAVGHVPPDQIMAVLSGLIAGGERPAAHIRDEYRRAFPRTTAALSRLFVLDTLETTANTDGSTTILLRSRLDAERMRPYAPRYAEYIKEYLDPLRMELALVDARGAAVGSATFRNDTLRVRVRARNGVLQPLVGGNAGSPDSLRLRASFFAKVLFFEVGATNIRANIVPVHEGGVARGWSLRFRQEPRWHFPLAVSRLLRAPLRRPFADDGIRLEFLARATETGQTVLARNIGIVVQESAIVRWIGGLGATAMGDLSVLAEQEKDRYVGDVFRALADDSRDFFVP